MYCVRERCAACLVLAAVLLLTACDYIVVEGRLGGDECDAIRIAFWSSLGQPIRTTEYHDARLYTYTDYHSDGSYHSYYYIQSVYGLDCTHETGRASDIEAAGRGPLSVEPLPVRVDLR